MNKLLPLISLLALLTISQAVTTFEIEDLWSTWKARYQKSYGEVEEKFRLGVFSHNYKRILKFNEENDTPRLALNHFADLTKDEFKAFHLNPSFSGPERYQERPVVEFNDVDVGALPASIDWRNRGAVTGVKNQGQCGSCWAFSATGLLEGFNFINTGKLLSFSEQQIVDCDIHGTDMGCDGGFPWNAINYTLTAGIETEEDYPYTATQGQCNYNASLAHHVAGGYTMVKPNSTDQLKAALVQQPVSVVIEADQDVVEFYASGVIKTGCGAELDHCMLAVGYHKVGVIESFIVKNSWGTDWGESGYAEIWSNNQANGGEGVCGILGEPTIVTK